MIELAPRNKLGLSIANPIMPAAGCFGYGPEYSKLLNVAGLGAVVTNPVTLKPRSATLAPRFVPLSTGFVLDAGSRNPGVKQVIRRYVPVWRALTPPVVAFLAADQPAALRRTATALESTQAVDGLELELPTWADLDEVYELVTAVRHSELPLWVRLPFYGGQAVAAACEDWGADALVVSAPPPAAARHADGQVVSGGLFGPQVLHLILALVLEIKNRVDLPLIACGGVHSSQDVELLLAAGALAVQVDSLFYCDPSAVERLARSFA